MTVIRSSAPFALESPHHLVHLLKSPSDLSFCFPLLCAVRLISIMSSPSSNDSQVIPVPPGMTVEQYLDLQGHLGQP
jgi:hypothetical protein